MFIVEHEINYNTIFFIEKSLLGIYLQISVYYENSIITPSMVTYSILIHNSDSQWQLNPPRIGRLPLFFLTL